MVAQSNVTDVIVVDTTFYDSFELSHDTLISRHGVIIFNWIVWATVAQAVVVFGIISNIINMVCFVNQGFKDSINVSLTGNLYFVLR